MLQSNHLIGFGAVADAVVWTPAILSPTAWYDPSDISTLFQDAAATTPVTASGDPVGCMLDKSGNGRHLTQSTSGNRPTYTVAGGLEYLAFDGSNDGLTASGALSFQTVVTCTNVSGGSTAGGLFTNTSDQGSDIDFAFARSNSNWDTNLSAGGGGFGSSKMWNNRVQTSSINIGSVRVYTGDTSNYTGGTKRFPNGISMGYDRSFGTGRSLGMNMYGLVAINSILASGDLTTLEDWLAAKGGITI